MTYVPEKAKQIFMGLLLHPNRISIGKATTLTKYKLKEQEQDFIQQMRLFADTKKWFKSNNCNKWVLCLRWRKSLV